MEHGQLAGHANDTEMLPVWQRLAWMAGLWLASVSLLGAIAYGIRLLLKAA